VRHIREAPIRCQCHRQWFGCRQRHGSDNVPASGVDDRYRARTRAQVCHERALAQGRCSDGDAFGGNADVDRCGYRLRSRVDDRHIVRIHVGHEDVSTVGCCRESGGPAAYRRRISDHVCAGIDDDHPLCRLSGDVQQWFRRLYKLTGREAEYRKSQEQNPQHGLNPPVHPGQPSPPSDISHTPRHTPNSYIKWGKRVKRKTRLFCRPVGFGGREVAGDFEEPY